MLNGDFCVKCSNVPMTHGFYTGVCEFQIVPKVCVCVCVNRVQSFGSPQCVGEFQQVCCIQDAQILRRKTQSKLLRSLILHANSLTVNRIHHINCSVSPMPLTISSSLSLIIPLSLPLSFCFSGNRLPLRRGVCLHLSKRKKQRGSSTNTAQPDIMQGESFPRSRVLKC